MWLLSWVFGDFMGFERLFFTPGSVELSGKSSFARFHLAKVMLLYATA